MEGIYDFVILAVKQGANDEALALLSTHESHLPEAPPAGFHFEQLPSYHLSLDQLLKKGTPEAERCLIELFRNSYVDMRNAKAGMLQDLELGRKTEVDWLNGYICRTGRELSVPTPVNDRLVALIHDIEDGKQGLSFAGNLEYLMEH